MCVCGVCVWGVWGVVCVWEGGVGVWVVCVCVGGCVCGCVCVCVCDSVQVNVKLFTGLKPGLFEVFKVTKKV